MKKNTDVLPFAPIKALAAFDDVGYDLPLGLIAYGNMRPASKNHNTATPSEILSTAVTSIIRNNTYNHGIVINNSTSGCLYVEVRPTGKQNTLALTLYGDTPAVNGLPDAPFYIDQVVFDPPVRLLTSTGTIRHEDTFNAFFNMGLAIEAMKKRIGQLNTGEKYASIGSVSQGDEIRVDHYRQIVIAHFNRFSQWPVLDQLFTTGLGYSHLRLVYWNELCE